MRLKTKTTIALLALATCLSLAACGGESKDTVSGQFELVPGAPPGYSQLSGEASLTRSDDGTEASLELSGLRPATEYVAHVHVAGCDQADPGGPHFRFEEGGPETAPNEIHFAFASSDDGGGSAEASDDRRVPEGEAGSIVVHTAEEEGAAMDGSDGEHGHAGQGHSHSEKVACARLEGGSAPSAGGGAGDDEAPAGEEAMRHDEKNAEPGETIVVRGGKPAGGVAELVYDAGEQVRFRVRSDVADEIHVHGYDLSEDVAAGGTASFSFPADIEGIFEVELEQRGEQLAQLRVEP